MATYKQTRVDVQEKYGVYMQNCWIAHVKELNGWTLVSSLVLSTCGR